MVYCILTPTAIIKGKYPITHESNLPALISAAGNTDDSLLTKTEYRQHCIDTWMYKLGINITGSGDVLVLRLIPKTAGRTGKYPGVERRCHVVKMS